MLYVRRLYAFSAFVGSYGRCRQSPVRSDADIPYVLVFWEYKGGWCLVHEGSILAATLLLAFPCSDLAIVCGDTVRRGSSRKRL